MGSFSRSPNEFVSNAQFGFWVYFFFRVSSASAAAAVVDSSISKGFQGLY